VLRKAMKIKASKNKPKISAKKQNEEPTTINPYAGTMLGPGCTWDQA